VKDVTLTPTSYLVLGMVSVAGEATPYDLKQMLAASAGHFWSVPHSQVYAESSRLAKAGFLAENRERSGRRRKRYSLTPRGRKTLDEWIGTPTADSYELRDPGLLKLALGADPSELAAAQLDVHKEKLALFEGILEQMKKAGAPRAQQLLVESGIGHEREYIRFWRKAGRSKI
jgi:PadR family transcriptional regulator, regulatory protein AphA